LYVVYLIIWLSSSSRLPAKTERHRWLPSLCNLSLVCIFLQLVVELFYPNTVLHHKMLHGGGRFDGMCIGG
jgi:hypothetical protein